MMDEKHLHIEQWLKDGAEQPAPETGMDVKRQGWSKMSGMLDAAAGATGAGIGAAETSGVGKVHPLRAVWGGVSKAAVLIPTIAVAAVVTTVVLVKLHYNNNVQTKEKQSVQHEQQLQGSQTAADSAMRSSLSSKEDAVGINNGVNGAANSAATPAGSSEQGNLATADNKATDANSLNGKGYTSNNPDLAKTGAASAESTDKEAVREGDKTITGNKNATNDALRGEKGNKNTGLVKEDVAASNGNANKINHKGKEAVNGGRGASGGQSSANKDNTTKDANALLAAVKGRKGKGSISPQGRNNLQQDRTTAGNVDDPVAAASGQSSAQKNNTAKENQVAALTGGKNTFSNKNAFSNNSAKGNEAAALTEGKNTLSNKNALSNNSAKGNEAAALTGGKNTPANKNAFSNADPDKPGSFNFGPVHNSNPFAVRHPALSSGSREQRIAYSTSPAAKGAGPADGSRWALQAGILLPTSNTGSSGIGSALGVRLGVLYNLPVWNNFYLQPNISAGYITGYEKQFAFDGYARTKVRDSIFRVDSSTTPYTLKKAFTGTAGVNLVYIKDRLTLGTGITFNYAVISGVQDTARSTRSEVRDTTGQWQNIAAQSFSTGGLPGLRSIGWNLDAAYFVMPRLQIGLSYRLLLQESAGKTGYYNLSNPNDPGRPVNTDKTGSNRYKIQDKSQLELFIRIPLGRPTR